MKVLSYIPTTFIDTDHRENLWAELNAIYARLYQLMKDEFEDIFKMIPVLIV